MRRCSRERRLPKGSRVAIISCKRSSPVRNCSSWGSPMSWRQLSANHRVRRHKTSRQELDDLRAVIARDLQDAALPGLDAANVASDTEAQELLQKAQAFHHPV